MRGAGHELDPRRGEAGALRRVKERIRPKHASERQEARIALTSALVRLQQGARRVSVGGRSGQRARGSEPDHRVGQPRVPRTTDGCAEEPRARSVRIGDALRCFLRDIRFGRFTAEVGSRRVARAKRCRSLPVRLVAAPARRAHPDRVAGPELDAQVVQELHRPPRPPALDDVAVARSARTCSCCCSRTGPRRSGTREPLRRGLISIAAGDRPRRRLTHHPAGLTPYRSS